MSRNQTPIKLSRVQLNRIRRDTGFRYEEGFRINMGGTMYYFLHVSEFNVDGIQVCTYDFGDHGAAIDITSFRPTSCYLSGGCVPIFNKALKRMQKLGWL